MKCSLADVKKIIKLGKLGIDELRKINKELERSYTGKELTKVELIYQITFSRDAPFK